MDPLSQQKPQKTKIIFLLAIIVIVIIGGVAWFTYFKKAPSGSSPAVITSTLEETAPQGTTFSVIPSELLPIKDIVIVNSQHLVSTSTDGVADVWTVNYTAASTSLSTLFTLYTDNVFAKNGYKLIRASASNGVGVIGATKDTAVIGITLKNTTPTAVFVTYRKLKQ